MCPALLAGFEKDDGRIGRLSLIHSNPILKKERGSGYKEAYFTVDATTREIFLAISNSLTFGSRLSADASDTATSPHGLMPSNKSVILQHELRLGVERCYLHRGARLRLRFTGRTSPTI